MEKKRKKTEGDSQLFTIAMTSGGHRTTVL